MSMSQPYQDAFVCDGATYPSYGQTATPTAVYDPTANMTWVVWEAFERGHRVTRIRVFHHAAGNWGQAITIGASPLKDDDHGAPTIARHCDGHWHVFYGAHCSDIKHAMTLRPDDPSIWIALPDITGSLTYPCPVRVASTLYLFLRGYAVVSDTRYLSLCTVETDGTVSRIVKLADLDARFYSGGYFVKPGTREIHLVATKGAVTLPPLTHVYYLIYDTNTGRCRNFSGTVNIAPDAMPIPTVVMDHEFRLFAHDDSHDGGVPSFCFDAAGDPHLIYYDGLRGARNDTVYHRTYNNDGWSEAYPLGETEGCDVALTPNASGGVHAYWGKDGQRFGMLDLWTASRSSDGTWSESTVLRIADRHALAAPSMVIDGTPALRQTFFEVLYAPDPVMSDAAPGAGTLHGFAYGDHGYVTAHD